MLEIYKIKYKLKTVVRQRKRNKKTSVKEKNFFTHYRFTGKA